MQSFTERSYEAQVSPEQPGSTTLVSAPLRLCTPCHALQSNPRYRHLVEKELSQDEHTRWAPFPIQDKDFLRG